MSLSLLALAFLGLLTAGYLGYGGWVARQFALDDRRPTPAERLSDGEDFVPTRPFYLFAQHFSAIAAAGPIAGPIIACQAFGWLPCLLWIGLGVVLIGAVHDFTSLVASVRHGAVSVAEIAREHLGARGGAGDDGLHLDRAGLRHRRLRRPHRGELRGRHRRAAAGPRGLQSRRSGGGRERDVSGARSAARAGAAVPQAAALAGHRDLRSRDLRRCRGWARKLSHAPGARSPHLGAPDPRSTAASRRWCRCGRCSSRAATSAASSSTPRSRSGIVGIFFGGYEIQQPAFRPGTPAA